MRKLTCLIASAAMVAAIVTFAVSGPGAAQQETRPADAAPVPYNPMMGDLMNILIQPRHIKLWLAGQQENWALAGYALKEIKQSFARISAGVPQLNGAPVADLIESAVGEQIGTLDFAIKAGEPRQFAENYKKLTAGCNSCHASTGHSYIVIKVPDGAAFANQDFQPKR
jgi:hypothetical protein